MKGIPAEEASNASSNEASPNEGSLPQGWAIARLGDLGEFINGDRGKNYPSRSLHVAEGVPFINAGHLRDGRVDLADMNYIAEKTFALLRSGKILPDDILYCLRGSLGKAAVVSNLPRGAIASSLLIVRPFKEMVSRYIYFFLVSPLGQTFIRKYDNGTAQPNLSGKNVEKYLVPIAPLAEQRSIVEDLDSYLTRLDAAVEGLKRVEANLKRYRASVLKAAVEGRLVPTEAELAKQEGRDYESGAALLARILKERRRRWEESELARMIKRGDLPANDRWKAEYEEPEGPDAVNLPDLPKGWCWATVEQLGIIASGQTPNGVDARSRNDGEVPWYRVSDMNAEGNEEFLGHAVVNLSVPDAGALGLHIRPPGTIVFPKRGGAIATNKKRKLIKPSAYDLNIMGVIPSEHCAGYLWTWFSKLDLASLSDGSNVPQINHRDVAPLPVPLPPALEQQRIVGEAERLLSVGDKAIAAQVRGRLRIARLHQSILNWSFEGKLVDQDPKDEPASLLLHRIRQERAAVGQNARRPERAPTRRNA